MVVLSAITAGMAGMAEGERGRAANVSGRRLAGMEREREKRKCDQVRGERWKEGAGEER